MPGYQPFRENNPVLIKDMNSADNRGVLTNYARTAPKCDTTGLFSEIIGNRKHGPPSADRTTTFMFATFDDFETRIDKNNEKKQVRVPYFIIGSSQPRSQESIDYELTPFKSNRRAEEESSRLREKGSGAKLPLFNLLGHFSILYQISDHEMFSSNEGDWMMTRETNMRDLVSKLMKEGLFEIGPFMPYHMSANESSPFWRLDSIMSTDMMDWIRRSKMRSFYVYRDYLEKLDLDDHIERLALIYEGTDVQILRSKNGSQPLLVTAKPYVSLGLIPKYWKDSITVYCKLGTLAKKFFDSQFKICLPSRPMYLKLLPNGKKENPTPNLTEDKESSWENTEADFSITGAILTDDFVAHEPIRKETGYFRQADSMISRMAFVRIEEDLISDKPVADDEIGISIRTALLDMDGAFRIIINLINARVKDSVDSGLVIEPFKRDTKLRAKHGIHECIKRVCTILKRCYRTSFDETSIRRAADSLALHRDNTKRRSTEGKKYEQIVCDQLISQFDMIAWTMGDVAIQTRHGLIGQGIDALGTWGGTAEAPAYGVAIQIKDVKTLTVTEVQKFTMTVRNFQEKNPDMLMFPFLVWRNPKESIPRKVYEELDEIDGRLVFDSNIYSRINREISGHYED